MTETRFKRSNSLSSSERSEFDAESVIAELKEKMSRLKFRLFDCQNQNQMLRKELLLAKKVVNSEVSPASNEDFKDLLNQSTSTDFRGRREKILLLKDKLNELQNQIKRIEEGDFYRSNYEGDVKTPKVNRLDDPKMFQSKQMMDKELQYLLENSCQMKRKLELWKKRNTSLNNEADLLRLELDSLLEKSKEDRDVHESYNIVEKELRARQSEKLDMRSKLNFEKTRNEQLVEELANLKEDISLILSKTNDDKTLIDSLKNQQGHLYDLLERQKMISESDNRRFRDDMREIQTKHTTNNNILSQLKAIVQEKNLKYSQLRDSLKVEALLDTSQKKEEEISSVITTESEQSQQEPLPQTPPPTDDPAPEPNEEQSEMENEIIKLGEECEQYKNIFLSTQEEIEHLTRILSSNDERLNEWLSQLLQSRSLLAQKNAEVRNIDESATMIQKLLSTTKKRITCVPFGSSCVEDIKTTSDIVKEENQFLLSLQQLLMTNKGNRIMVLKMSIDLTGKLFADAINDLMLPEDESDVEQQMVEENDEEPAYLEESVIRKV